ncbi:MAG: LutC/YkgG family protein, partial [Janthinobacterium lividum]
MSARDDVLARIAGAHRSAPPPDLPYAAIERGYRTTSDLGPDALVELLVERLVDYRAQVRRCAPDQVGATVAAALRDRGLRSLAVPPGLDRGWLVGTDVDVVRDEVDSPLGVDELDRLDGVLTACALAVAETGTLVLDASPDQGRRVLSLIPDYHLCVVLPEQLCAD